MTGKTTKNGVRVELNGAPPQTSAERATQRVATESLMAQGEEARLIAEQRATAARLKQLRASRPQASALDHEVARQEAMRNRFIPAYMAGQVRARIAAGQPEAEAIEAVLALARTHLVAALAEAPTPAAEEPTEEPK